MYALFYPITFPMDTGASIISAIGLNEVTSVLNKRAEVPLLSQGMLSKSLNLAHDYPCEETTQQQQQPKEMSVFFEERKI